MWDSTTAFTKTRCYLELAVFDCLVEICKQKNLEKTIGYYFKTEKNGYVADLFDNLGFTKITNDIWEFDLRSEYKLKNKYIKTEREIDI